LSACLYRESLTGLTDTTLSQVPPGCLTDLILHLPLAGVFFCLRKRAGRLRAQKSRASPALSGM